MTLLDIISKFDVLNGEKFNEIKLNSALRELNPNDDAPLSPDLLAEFTAFNFSEDYPNEKTGWGTYFGPMAVWNNGDGTISEIPSITVITPEIIDYWYKRAKESTNPIIIARYSGLVYDFSQKICNKKPSNEIADIYIKALIYIANGDFCSSPTDTYKKLKRALSLSLSRNNKTFIEKCKKALISYENLKIDISKPGLWGHSYDLLVNNSKVNLTNDEEQSIILKLEEVYRQTSNTKLNTFNLWSAENAFERLSSFYHRNKDIEKLENIIENLVLAYEYKMESQEPMQIADTLEKIYTLYKKYNYSEKAKMTLIRIREFGPTLFNNLKKIPFDFSIKTEIIEKFTEEMLSGNTFEVLIKIANYYIPNKKIEESNLKINSEKYSLSRFFSKQIQDYKGRIICNIGSFETDFEGNLIQHISQTMQLQSIFFHHLLNKAFRDERIKKKDIIDFLKLSPVIEPERFIIINKALDAYFNNDFLLFLHLIIPQIEEGIRNFIEFNRGVVLKPKKEAYQLKTFDELLRDDILIENFSSDLSFYFRTLFTDQRGWNLRNTICHGMTSPNTFSSISGNRVFHALLCFGLIRET